jgi:lipoprotein-releasing system permease protein
LRRVDPGGVEAPDSTSKASFAREPHANGSASKGHTTMGYAWTLGLRYLRSKKRAFISVGTLFAILGVALGVAALATVMSVTGGFQKQFRDKVLGVNAHVLVLKRTPEFSEYRDVMEVALKTPGVVAVAPFVINPMLVTAGDRTATGVLMKGVDPDEMPKILDLPSQIKTGSMVGLRRPGAEPPARTKGYFGTPDLPKSKRDGSSGAPESAVGAPSPRPGASSAAGAGVRDTSPSEDPYIRILERRLAEKTQETARVNALEAEQAALVAVPSASASAGTNAPPTAPAGDFDTDPTADTAAKLPTDVEEDGALKVFDKQDNAKVADSDLPGVIIGQTLATSLNVGVGERIRITSPAIGFSFSGSSRAPIARQFRVIALFEAGFDQYDSKLVYVDLYEAQAFYDQGDSVTGVEMRVNDIDHGRRIRDDLEKRLGNGIYHVMDWEELNHPLFTALRIQQIGMSAVLALIIVVAAFTVVATLIMIVLDKRKEIAVLKAMGARDGAILRAFLYQGMIIGGIGTSIGLSMGFVFCKIVLRYGFPLDPKVYFISRLPVEVRPQEFLLTGAIAMLICLAATVIPALHAASIRPADGLRAQ